MEELIRRLKRKEEKALREVMGMYKSQVFNYLNLMLGNRELAEELTQDTFVKVYFKAHTLKTHNLKSWVFTIATNLARSEFRRMKFKNMLSLSDVGDANYAYSPEMGLDVEFEQVLSCLPAKYRVPVIMKEVNNFSFDEIAEMLRKPVGTVKSLVFRGRKYLQQQLAVGKGGIDG